MERLKTCRQPIKEVFLSCLICRHTVKTDKKNLFDTRFGIPEPYDVGTCQTCGLLQLTNPPDLKKLGKLYQGFYNFEGKDNRAYQQKRAQLQNSILYQWWLCLDGDISFHTKKGTGRLLDIGCNEGRSLRLYQRNGFSVEGLETNTVAAKAARTAGFTVHTQELDDFKSSKKFDVAVLSNVLEHFLDPVMKLKKIGAILTPEGEVWISCPNQKSWLRPLFGKNWINWHIPFHISQFNTETLANVLAEAGFRIRDDKTVTPALWASQSFLVSVFARPGHPTKELRSPLLMASLMLVIRGLLFPLLWFGNLLGRGDCLVVVAEKN